MDVSFIDSKAQDRLREAAEQLEAMSDPPSSSSPSGLIEHGP